MSLKSQAIKANMMMEWEKKGEKVALEKWSTTASERRQLGSIIGEYGVYALMASGNPAAVPLALAVAAGSYAAGELGAATAGEIPEGHYYHEARSQLKDSLSPGSFEAIIPALESGIQAGSKVYMKTGRMLPSDPSTEPITLAQYKKFTGQGGTESKLIDNWKYEDEFDWMNATDEEIAKQAITGPVDNIDEILKLVEEGKASQDDLKRIAETSIKGWPKDKIYTPQEGTKEWQAYWDDFNKNQSLDTYALTSNTNSIIEEEEKAINLASTTEEFNQIKQDRILNQHWNEFVDTNFGGDMNAALNEVESSGLSMSEYMLSQTQQTPREAAGYTTTTPFGSQALRDKAASPFQGVQAIQYSEADEEALAMGNRLSTRLDEISDYDASVESAYQAIFVDENQMISQDVNTLAQDVASGTISQDEAETILSTKLGEGEYKQPFVGVVDDAERTPFAGFGAATSKREGQNKLGKYLAKIKDIYNSIDDMGSIYDIWRNPTQRRGE